ncbi:apolipoprotein N-acyltransferase [Glaciecola sp. MH2013]|uniref:apolipoprotein N-acyltransferase n=1 Tax=Glaciecola sp. MH2013 TaxID=2785524 RepID=UPI00189E2CA5|nr:apolipoprotein N-acyltransferase [Glaciecola sp. MH2013]MBF7073505.1 apolipoprotein N-acyltransferase [Glaciecola sp. MH2013]
MRSLSIRLLLSVVFGLALSLAFLEHDFYVLSWLAFVPLFFALQGSTFKQAYVLSLVGSFVAFATGKYWIIDFIVISKGATDATSLFFAFLYWFYCAHLFVFAILLTLWLKRNSRLPLAIIFPVVFTAFTAGYPLLFSMHLGDTQVRFTAALQAIEYTGVHGLNAIVALANVWVYSLLHKAICRIPGTTANSVFSRLEIIMPGIILVAWFAYGSLTLEAWQQKITQWPSLKVGMIQSNEIPSLGKKVSYPGYSASYLPEMEMSERLAKLDLDLIVWPESQYKSYLDNNFVADAFKRSVADMGTAILFQDFETIAASGETESIRQFNSAVFIDAKGEQAPSYRKIKRIPFGEYLPIVSDNPHLKRLASSYLGEFLNEISAGESYVSMPHPSLSLVPLICYETTFPSFVANALDAALATERKSAVLVGMSNDGWFGSTHQPKQHITVSALRAVENRTPLVHVANNGPSIVVAASGEITFEADFQQAGGYVAELKYADWQNTQEEQTKQGSFYSRHPSLFIYSMYVVLVLMLAHTLLLRLFFNKDR